MSIFFYTDELIYLCDNCC